MIFLSKDPKIFFIEGFLSESECKELIVLNRSKLLQSKVTDGRKIFDSSLRKGKHTYLSADQLSTSLKKKVSIVHNWDILDVETPQLISYSEGDWYAPHYDAFDSEALENTKNVNQRIFTNIIYLNENFIGGETEFTKLNLRVKPKTGMLLSFQNCLTNTNYLHPFMEHSSTPIKEGEKNIISIWLTSKKYV